MDTRFPHSLTLGIRLLAVSILTVFALTLLPVTARADGYSMDSVRIDAAVQSDGALAVTETREFSFDDDINGVYWVIPFSANRQGKQSNVQVTGVSEGGAFRQVDAAQKGNSGVYTVGTVNQDGEEALNLKVFTPHDDGDSTSITVSYVVTGAVMNWSDTAELYWKFIGDGWSESSRNVTATFAFPSDSLAAEPATKGKNFRAWGHGPLTGDVAVDGTAPSVAFTIPRVRSGEYAEARIVFPSAWVPGLSASSEKRLPTVLKEEKQWAEEANARRERARVVAGVMAAVTVIASAALLVVVAVLKVTRGRSPKPVFVETYFRDVPSDAHPAVIAAFMERQGKVPDRAFVASLMKLTDDRVITMEKSSATRKGFLGREVTDDDYRLTVPAETMKNTADKIDKAVLNLYFAGAHADADGIKSRSFDDLHDYASDHTEAYSKRCDAFKTKVEADIERRNLVASKGTGVMAATCVVAGLILVFGIFQLIYTDLNDINFIAFCVSMLLLCVAVVIGCTFRRLTQEGAELKNKCRALKKWLEDFTRLGEAVPSDLILWNKLMVMAVALGVSKETLRQLADAVPPEVRESDDFYDYYPVYWWCYGHHGMDAPVESLHQAYHESIAELASSSDSSIGGIGGGFSGGGGGGIGGGGGGTF